MSGRLIKAEEAYRVSVRRLRTLGESVSTVDSTHISNLESGEGSNPSDVYRRIHLACARELQPWIAGLPPSPTQFYEHDDEIRTVRRPSAKSIYDDGATVHPYDSYSTINELNPSGVFYAKRKRAADRNMASRDSSHFKRQRRCRERPDTPPPPPPPEQEIPFFLPFGDEDKDKNQGPTRRFLYGSQRAEWPEEATKFIFKRHYQRPESTIVTKGSIVDEEMR